MGRYARNFLGVNSFSLRADVFTGSDPPLSCLADGIQVGSGCTLGKNNIAVREGGRPEVLFTARDGRTLQLQAKEGLIARIRSEVTEDNIIEYSGRIHSEPDENLFEVVGR
jgi:formylmethanofuran dehydrogenase subunit E